MVFVQKRKNMCLKFWKFFEEFLYTFQKIKLQSLLIGPV